jgi:hypothetical protein
MSGVFDKLSGKIFHSTNFRLQNHQGDKQ